jgi:cell division protease FtsH
VKRFFRGASFYLVLAIVILMLLSMNGFKPSEEKVFTVSEVVKMLNADQIASIKIKDNQLTGVLKDKTEFAAYLPTTLKESFGQDVYQSIVDKGLIIEGEQPSSSPFLLEILPTIFTILILVVFWFVFMQNSQGGGNKVMSFGKSKARLHKDDEDKRITFAEVAGLKEEKEEMMEIVDFLKAPKKYVDLGARIPKGILMVGPPGTGKTYLTRAVAGEAGVPFFSISGSDFVEMFVGVGASRVRDLFENAKKNAPCIIFIDEIDAVGRKRGAGLGGGHDEREQTLNQLLVEMDGFSDHEGIIVIAATNRPDILDPALLRPGRFDREITVGIPDVAEREEILQVHAKNKPVADDVNFRVIAKGTPGFTPADLENVLNEAALMSARKNDKTISIATVEAAITKITMGVEKKSRVESLKNRNLVAYHEAGHAVLAKLLPDTDPVHQITIIPRGRGAGGFTMQLPQDDRHYRTKKQMEKDIVIYLGGRLAEKIVLDDISTGASSDLAAVTRVARAMVTKYAMSENLSQMSYASEDEVFLGRDMTTIRNFSEQVAAEIDREVRRIVDDAYEVASELLTENIDKLHDVAKSLLEYETLNGLEFDMAFDHGFEALKEARENHTLKKVGMFDRFVSEDVNELPSKNFDANGDLEVVEEAEIVSSTTEKEEPLINQDTDQSEV